MQDLTKAISYCEKRGIFPCKMTSNRVVYYRGDFTGKRDRHGCCIPCGVYKHIINLSTMEETVVELKRIPHCAKGSIYDN